MNVLYQESIHSRHAINERVSSLFFLLSLLLHAIAMCLFLIAGFRAKQRATSNADAHQQQNPFSLTSLRGRPSQVFFDNRPVSPAIGAPQGMAMPTGVKPSASAPSPVAKAMADRSELRRDEIAKPSAKAQRPSKNTPAAKRKAATRPKAIARPRPLAQPIPLQPDAAAPITVAATQTIDASEPLETPMAQATNQVTTGPITNLTEPASAPNLSTEALAKGDDSTVVFTRHAGQQATSKGTDGAYVASARRNLIAMTKGFIERTDIDDLEDTIATDGQGDDEETCQGDAKREASALEFSIYRTKVGNQYVNAWHEHFSHIPIKQMYQARNGLMFNNAIITYTISREGKLLACELEQSTGNPELDRRILKSFELAEFPPFPRHFAQQTFTFTETIQANHLDGSERFLELIRC